MRATRWLMRAGAVVLALVLVMEVFAGEALARPRHERGYRYSHHSYRSRCFTYVPRVVVVPRVTYYYPRVYYYYPPYYDGVTYYRYAPSYRSGGGIYLQVQW
jgi:hypothetical protein